MSAGAPPPPRVSVLIPAYNAARFLAETLDSVSAQTFRDFEIVVVDDGSKDDTAAILRRHAAGEPRLVIVNQPNGGISNALNNGLARCRGELVARMDADDLMMPDRLEKQVAFLDGHPELGFCASSIVMIDAAGRRVGEYVSPLNSLAELETMIAERRYFSFTHPTVTFRHAAMTAAGGYDRTFEPCEDVHLFLRLIDAGQPGVALREPLLRYRLHGSSISGTNALKQVQMRNYLFHRWYAERAGEAPIGFDEYVRTGGEWGRWARWRDRADATQAVARYRLAIGRRASGAALMALAMLMKLDRVPMRLWRKVRGR